VILSNKPPWRNWWTSLRCRKSIGNPSSTWLTSSRRARCPSNIFSLKLSCYRGSPNYDETFVRLYCAALTGLCAQNKDLLESGGEQ
jgi:hypothetical protein